MHPAMSHRPARSSPGAGPSAQRSHMLAAVIAWALVRAAAPVLAEADAACSAAAAAILEDYAEANPAFFTNAGCDEAGDYTICDLRGSAGPCSANPICPENQIDTFTCPSDAAAANATCCLEEYRKPACDGCAPVLTACISSCGGRIYPPITVEEQLNEDCVDIADLALPGLAADFPAEFTAGCDGAAPGLVCDLNGYGGACTEVAQCAGLPVSGNCSPAAAESGCCVAFVAVPCEGCDPEPIDCAQTCAAEPVAAALLTGAASCAARYDGVLESLAMMNPTAYANGCDNSDPNQVCDLQSFAGSCEANPVCPSDQIIQGACTEDTGPPECCEVLLAKACDACEPIPLRCLNVCPSAPPAAPLTAQEAQAQQCTDEGDLFLSFLRNVDPDFVAESCTVAEPGQLCDIVAGVGPCSSMPDCTGVDISRGTACTEENEDSACCEVTLAVLCPGCAAVPVLCDLIC